MYFCIHNCTSPSNDFTAVACSNNNQAQLYTHVSVPYWSPDVWLDLELLRDIQFGLLRAGSGRGNPPNFGCASCTSGWTPLSKSATDYAIVVQLVRHNVQHLWATLHDSPTHDQKIVKVDRWKARPAGGWEQGSIGSVSLSWICSCSVL